MYNINPFLLLILPLIFQLVLGRMAIRKTIRFHFLTVSLISFILQLGFSYLAIEIVSQKLNEAANGRVHCGMPIVGVVFMDLLCIGALITIIIVQYFLKRRYEKAQ
ncbi:MULTISPECIES: hypothetical protein [Flavobacterium]|uniref:MotA/TolQ/ExbB proton channel domain-containing protein n=1 Tax=Flavobacterium endoglycinae TaxID=2816357 RepID=A0ABX7Q9B0_9FLAO|nr:MULTISPECIES: hypothetical protein [Flavobacterium]QSW87606.1 hypothetical protein J0383_15080 [Flavobacterium endoglycinae]